MVDKTKRNFSRSKKKNPNASARKRKLEAAKAATSNPSASSTSNDALSSSSAKKLCKKQTITMPSSDAHPELEVTDLGNSLVNMNLLVTLINKFKCVECKGDLVVKVQDLGGLAQKIVAICSNCEHTVSQDLSEHTDGKSHSQSDPKF